MNHEYDLVEARQKDGQIAAREKGESCTVPGWTIAHRTHPRGLVHVQCVQYRTATPRSPMAMHWPDASLPKVNVSHFHVHLSMAITIQRCHRPLLRKHDVF